MHFVITEAMQNLVKNMTIGKIYSLSDDRIRKTPDILSHFFTVHRLLQILSNNNNTNYYYYHTMCKLDFYN